MTPGDGDGPTSSWLDVAREDGPDSPRATRARSAADTSPDSASPDRISPDCASSDRASTDRASPDRASPDRASPDRASPDRARSGRRGRLSDTIPRRPVRADGGRPVRVAVNGAGGRMGETVIETAADREGMAVTFGIDLVADTDHEPPIYDGGAVASATMNHGADVFVDFSAPESTVELVQACADQNVALVTGTTGLADDQLRVLEDASAQVPVLRATNFSRGIHALLHALEPALDVLPDYDVELAETHHNAKEDAPSGTAKTILRVIQERRDLEPVYGRQGVAPRSDDEIGVQVSRLDDVRGEHEVRLGGNDEVLSIAHRAEDRAVFAAGALDAAAWVADQNPGWYTFGDVISDQ